MIEKIRGQRSFTQSSDSLFRSFLLLLVFLFSVLFFFLFPLPSEIFIPSLSLGTFNYSPISSRVFCFIEGERSFALHGLIASLAIVDLIQIFCRSQICSRIERFLKKSLKFRIFMRDQGILSLTINQSLLEYEIELIGAIYLFR